MIQATNIFDQNKISSFPYFICCGLLKGNRLPHLPSLFFFNILLIMVDISYLDSGSNYRSYIVGYSTEISSCLYDIKLHLIVNLILYF